MNKSFWSELWFLMICAFAGIALTAAVTIPMGIMSSFFDEVVFTHVLQWMQTLLVMFIPALLWYRWRIKRNPWVDFGFTQAGGKMLLLTFILMICAIPALDFLAVANAKLPFPEALKTSADEMRATEEQALRALMSVNGLGGFIELILLMCIGTAIAEETMFRGALYKCFSLTKLNIHWIAILVGFIFSAIHFDLYGFIARWALGTLFCYLVYWSRSIWPAILAHTLNNLTALIEYKFYRMPDSSEIVDYSFSWYLNSLSFVVVCLLIIAMVKHSKLSTQ